MKGFAGGVGLDGMAAKGMGIHIGSPELLFGPLYEWQPCSLL